MVSFLQKYSCSAYPSVTHQESHDGASPMIRKIYKFIYVSEITKYYVITMKSIHTKDVNLMEENV